jgi:hypothetical protein
MTNFRAPDLSAPRYKRKTMNLLNRDLYKAFLERHPEYRDTLDLKTFKSIVQTYNGIIRDTTINYRDGVELPEDLGYIIVAKCDRSSKTNLDFASSIKYGKMITHRNWESDNYLAKICYSNYSLKYRFKDRELWSFIPIKTYRQSVSESFAEMHNKYIYLTDKLKLSELYKSK